jgi:hypothetical protein
MPEATATIAELACHEYAKVFKLLFKICLLQKIQLTRH